MAEATTTLSCPKCGGTMRSYERNGVVVDQCTDCRGIFLDRGELERLVDAEGRHYGDERDPRGGEREHERERGGKEGKRRKRHSFLEGLFESD
jgi:uncharacterized protein